MPYRRIEKPIVILAPERSRIRPVNPSFVVDVLCALLPPSDIVTVTEFHMEFPRSGKSSAGQLT